MHLFFAASVDFDTYDYELELPVMVLQQPPYVLAALGLVIGVLCGLTFARLIQDKLDGWKQDRLPLLPLGTCLLYTSPSPRDKRQSRMPSSA